ncbi:MAG: peroxide stress protein YaaA, partial [Miltoncostaeaceae bacterium]
SAAADWRAIDRAPTLPAWRRYAGVVWSALDPAGLDREAHDALLERVLIPSGAFGLLAAGDAVPAYRLKMGASVPAIGGLAAWWRPRIAPLVADRAHGGWIVDLLPGEHAAALDPARIARGGARLVRVALVTGEDAGSARAVGHAGKHAKGLLARAVLTHGARTPDEVAGLEVPGLRTLAVTADGPLHTVMIRVAPAGTETPERSRGR